MPRLLIVAQETGGIGKTTVTRGLAEAVTDVSILELESVHRLTEFTLSDTPNEPGAVRYFSMRASREAIERTGGQAARQELDPLINALYQIERPTILDLGANQSASVLGVMPDIIEDLRASGIEVGIVVVAAAEAGALADASKLLHAAKDWAAARFVVANELRGIIDPGLLKKAAGTAVVEHLRQFTLDDQARSVLAASALRGIPAIDKQALIKAYSPAVANRVMKDLTAFRLATMQAVKPAALWVIDAVEG